MWRFKSSNRYNNSGFLPKISQKRRFDAVQMKKHEKNRELIIGDLGLDTNERKAQIIAAAVLLFVQQGYCRTTVRQIAERAGVSMGGMYHHVHSKDAIFSLILEHAQIHRSKFTEKVKAKLTDFSATQLLRYSIQQHILDNDEFQDVYLCFFQEGKYLRRKDLRSTISGGLMWINTHKLVLEKGCASGEFEIRDTTVVAASISHLCDMWVLMRWLLREHYSVEQYIEEQQAFILAGVTETIPDTNPNKLLRI